MKSPLKYGLFSLILVAVVTIIVSGKWEWLFYGLILLCPLMHLFGHNHHSGHDNDPGNTNMK